MRAALAVAFTLAGSPALATGDIFCTAADGSDAEIAIGIGHVPVLAILSVSITARGEVWSTGASKDEIPVIVGQAFRDSRSMAVDFTDQNVEGVVAELRTWTVEEAGEWLEIGWLRLPGIGVHAVQCEGS